MNPEKKTIHLDDILNSPFNKPVQNVDSKVVAEFMNTPIPNHVSLPPTGKMHVHIEIEKITKEVEMFIKADIYNQDDLDQFLYKLKDYLPRKRLWGLF